MTANQRGGLILCGGRSQRLGTSKAWLEFAGLPLLSRVAWTLYPLVEELRVIGAPEITYPPLPDGAILERDPLPYCGPTPALIRGLKSFSQNIRSVFVCSCDLPFLDSNCVEYLFDLTKGEQIFIPTWQGRLHPLHAVYPSRVAQGVDWKAWENRRLLDWIESLQYQIIPEEHWEKIDPHGLSLTNINTLQDYQLALQRSHSTH
jgi:molybdopterin-guanine dinucleotide biosynthesis protein A